MRRSSPELHTLAAFVHGALVALHTLGALYNLRKGNRWQTVAHGAAIMFSAQSTLHHTKEAK